MSTVGQALGGVVGAAAGFLIGGPTGALYGAQIGMMAGGYLDPLKGPTQEGPRLSDLSVQTSTYGAFIPRVYGTVAQYGNVFWLEKNALKEVVKKKKSGGKGGGSSTTTKTYTYFATFAVGLCEGPVAGVRRIWAGPNLIYDASAATLESVISSIQQVKGFSIYYGDDTQLPDSRMQADLGAANTPSYRGLCYVVIKDLALAKYGNAIPSIKIEVVKQAEIPSVTSLTVIDAGTEIYSGGGSGSSAVCQPFTTALGTSFAYNDGAYWYTKTVWQNGAQEVRRVAEYGAANDGKYSAALGGVCDVATYALSEYNCQAVNIGGVRYASLPYTTGNASLQDVHQSGDDLILVRRISGVQLFNLKTGAYLDTSPHAFGVCLSAGLLYYVNQSAPTTLYMLDADDLTPAGSIALASGVTMNSGMTASVDSGVYWVWDSGYLYGWDIATGAQVENKTVPDSGHVGNKTAIVRDGVLSLGSTGSAVVNGQIETYRVTALYPETVPLSTIVSSECLLTGLLDAADIDVTELGDAVTGYRIAKIGSIRNGIEPVQGVFPFDVIQSGYKVKFISRGNDPVATADIGDLGVDQQLKQTREMDSQLPTMIVANYLDKSRNYDTNQQTWERPSSGAVNTRTMELPIVLSASQTVQAIERLGYLYWLERTDFGPFTLPPTFAHLEPADVITLDAGYAVYELRLTSVNYKSDGELECMGRLNNPSVYVSTAVADEVPDDAQVPLDGPSTYRLLDIPVIDETLQDAPGIGAVMAGYAGGWTGGQIFSSADGGQLWADLQAFASAGTFGTTLEPLEENDGLLIQYGGSLTINMQAGTLESITEAQMLNGLNACAYGADGRWEILHFQNATLNADGSYTLDTFWRGDKGTEWATGLHQSGDTLILLDDPDTTFIGLQSSAIGAPRIYRGITNGADISTDSDLPFTYAGVNLKPLSPTHAAGTRSAGDLLITWQRRTRIGGAWRDSVDASLGEATEAYEIDVMDGAEVVRTISTISQTATYTSAQQTADFGSPQTSVTVRIFQQSAVVGRGYQLEVTL